MNQKLNLDKVDNIVAKAGKLRKNYIKTNKYVKRMIDSLIDIGNIKLDAKEENYSNDKNILKNSNYLAALANYFSELYLVDLINGTSNSVSLNFKYTVLENSPNYFKITVSKKHIYTFEVLNSKPNEYWVVI